MPHRPTQSAGTEHRMKRMVTIIAAIIAITVSVLLPAGYFSLTYTSLVSHGNTRASMTADLVTNYISANPELWRFESDRISELIVRRTPPLIDEHIHVRDLEGNVIVAVGLASGSMEHGNAVVLKQNVLEHAHMENRVASIARQLKGEHAEMERGGWTLEARSKPIYDSGVVIGNLSVIHRMDNVLIGTALTGTLGLLLGLLTFFVLRVMPLRALNRALDNLRQEKNLAEVTLKSIGDAVVTTDAAERIEYLNPVAEALLGWRNDDAKGKPLGDIIQFINELTQKPVLSPLTQAMVTKSITGLTGDTCVIRRDGKHIPIEDNAAPILGPNGDVIGGVLVFHDVSSTRKLSTALSWQATHDSLTNLINRTEFEIRLERARQAAAAENRHHVLCYIDLDQFKVVNDTCGHAAGDMLLKQLTQLLQTRVRESDTLARLGGDEFGLLIVNCPIEQGQRIATGLLDAFNSFRFTWEDKVFNVGASIGVVPITTHPASVSKLMSDADAACYSAKEAGRNRIHTFRYQEADNSDQRGQMNWVSRITQALDQNRFRLHYQTYLSLKTDTATSGQRMELLVRMVGDAGEMIPPGSFIPAAERYNIMPSIDRWVIKNAFGQATYIAGKFGSDVCCSINLSGQALGDETIYDYIVEQINTFQVIPSMFCFEVTETAAVNELYRTAQLITKLKTLGFKFALDDFGSGMSSFSYLKNLPVDYLKIDGAFIKDVADNKVSLAMVKSMHQIAQAMGLETVAEFVDSDAILEVLRTIGIDYAQGYLICKPTALLEPDKPYVRPKIAVDNL